MQHSSIAVVIVPNDKGNPPGKLADAEIHFEQGPLAGSKLIGFAIWERRTRDGRNVTFPARQYSINGERRSFALLRPIVDVTAQAQIRDMILDAFTRYEQHDELRSEYDQDARRIDASRTQNAPLDQEETPKEAQRSTETREEPITRKPLDLSAMSQLQEDANTRARAELAQGINPGVIMGTMITEAVYGTAGPLPVTRGMRRF